MSTSDERLRRWRLILGSAVADALSGALSGQDQRLDQCLAALYGTGEETQDGSAASRSRRGGLGASSPRVAQWLGDIRQFFPSSVVQVMQQDAIERLGLRELLLEPEVLGNVAPDIHLVSTLLALKHVIPAKAKDTARQVVATVAEELLRKLTQPTREAVHGSLNRSVRNRRPRANEIDWPRTIRANLKHYQAEYQTVIPEVRLGFGHKRAALRDLVLCVDQSGSMAASVVYASLFAAVLTSLPAVSTRLVVFDTAVVDLTEALYEDPVDLLFGVQLGGGTDINRALGYCQGLITRPAETILVLISDLYEGGHEQDMLARMAALVQAGVQCITLLALSDDGAPSYDHAVATAYARMGIPCFACTPDQFPEVMAAALARQDLHTWAAARGIVTTRGVEHR